MSTKVKVVSSLMLGLVGGLAIMVIGGNRGLMTPFFYPKETLIFAGLIFVLSVLVLHFNFLWKKYRRLSFFPQILLLFPVALFLVLAREYVDSGFRFYLRDTTFYDSAYVVIVLLIGRSMLGKNFDSHDATVQWKQLIKRLLVFFVLAGALFVAHLFLLFRLGMICFMC